MPDRIRDREVRIKGEVGAIAGLPEQNFIPAGLLRVLQEGVVAITQLESLEHGLAGPGLGGNELAVGDGADDFVDIGQLAALGVDAEVIGIALEHETVGRRLGLQHPGPERGQLRIVVPVLIGLAIEEGGPVARARVLHRRVELGLVGIFGVNLLQELARLVDEEVRLEGEIGQETGVRLGPAVADRGRVQHLDLRELAVDEELQGRAQGVQLRVVGHILPVEAEILGGEGGAGRPLHPLAEVEGEDSSLLDIEALQQIGHQMVVRVIGDQLGIAVGHHVFDVLGGGEQRRQLAAVLPRRLARPLELGDRRVLRQALGDRRQVALLDGVGEEGRFLIGRRGKRAAGCEEEDDQSENRFHVAASVLSTRRKYSCSGPIWARHCINVVKEAWKEDPAWALR